MQVQEEAASGPDNMLKAATWRRAEHQDENFQPLPVPDGISDPIPSPIDHLRLYKEKLTSTSS